ncbi:MAG TPA: hypothetical protein DCP47_07685 [Phycisphaerales bacterium]|nr:hypothetical protein [Phycisphaerales bacterium]
MKMYVLQNLISQEAVQRIGWTLIHFIWQGALIALLLVIVLRLIRKQSSNLRYAVACAAMLFMVAAPAVTFGLLSKEMISTNVEIGQTHRSAPTMTNIVQIEMPVQSATPITPVKKSLKDRCIKATESALPYIVVCWFVGVFVLSIWYLGGWTQLQKLRRQMISPVSDEIKTKLNRLSKILALSRAVDAFQSVLVSVPTVIGHFKPVILLPASALTGLSGEQIEAILAHELAHIKRCDYIVNIFQTVVEILGFYHPAVWWVSNKIRQEREHCCDDIAVQITGDEINYAQALASMEEIRFGRPELAVAATGGNLFERIKRLLGRNSASNEKAGWLPSAIVVLVIAGLLFPMMLTLSSCGKKDTKKLSETSYIDANGHIVDKIDYPFVNDPNVLGSWHTVDFVKEIEEFKWDDELFPGKLFLREMIFKKDGRLISKNDNAPNGFRMKWTKGLVLYDNDQKTASKYTLKEMNDSTYMFYEWKSGDYTIRHQKPSYYVLKKVEDKIETVSESNVTNFLNNSGAEDGKGDLPSLWFRASVPADGLEMYRDTENVHSGKYSLAITNTHKYGETVSNNWAQNIQNIPVGSVINVSAYIKTENADSANVCIQCWDIGDKNMLAFTTTNTLRGDNNWPLLKSPPISVPDGTVKITVRAALTGIGNVWFDDIKVNAVNKKVGDSNIAEVPPRAPRPPQPPPPPTPYEPPTKVVQNLDTGVEPVKNFKQELEKPVTVNVQKSPDGDRLTIQYAVIAICEAAKVPYNWDKSVELADSQREKYIDPVNIENKVASQAIADLIGPVGLSYNLDEKGVYLYKPEKIQGESNFEILDVNFEPIHQGKNVVNIEVKNNSSSQQLLGVHIYTRSVDYGPSGVGWGTVFFDTLKENETKVCRFAYKIQGPVTANTYIRVKYYNPATEQRYNYDKPFFEKQYSAKDLPFAPVVVKEWLPGQMGQEIWSTLANIQTYIRKGDYEKAWELFSEDYQKSEYQRKGFEAFKQHMEPKHPLDAAFHWDKKTFVMLKFLSLEADMKVINEQGGPILEAGYRDQIWRIKFVHQQKDVWKIDDITGYTPKVLEIQEQDAKK